MHEFLKKLPDPLIRLGAAFIALIVLGVVVVAFVIPPRLKDVRLQWKQAVARETEKPARYAGAAACAECHEKVVHVKKAGYHKDLSCETCHGPAKAHTEDPDKVKPVVPRERNFCPQCHSFSPSRPRGFPMINPVAHNPMKPCITCHQPHDPKPPRAPRECSACHGEIARAKAVSHHVSLSCTTCHETPAGHKVSPRTIKPKKPEDRAFCGKCHGKDSPHKEAPKIDLETHGEKYVCWQCHYPHLPEVD